MTRIRLTISFDGTAYGGWQRQAEQPTIQATIEDALARMLGEPVVLHGAGRTDAGVHALGMVAAFTPPRQLPLVAYQRGLNSMLPPDIRVLAAALAPADFHPRFSAKGKTYRYFFSTAALMLPCRRRYRAHFPGPFAVAAVRAALPQLAGEHDFSAFEAVGSRDRQALGGRGAVRSLHRVRLVREQLSPADDLKPGPSDPGPDDSGTEFYYEFCGDGFLRHMVRNLVGTLLEIGRGRRTPDSVAALLASGDRAQAGPTAPACGLTLINVEYW